MTTDHSAKSAPRGRLPLRLRLLLAGGLAAAGWLLVAAAPAEAATSCTNPTITWDGLSSNGTGYWDDVENWTPQRIPSGNDVVCIPANLLGASPVVYTTEAIAALQAGSALEIGAGGSLSVSNSVQADLLTVSGELGGTADMTVTKLVMSNGRLTGTGTTTVPAAAGSDFVVTGGASVEGARTLDVAPDFAFADNSSLSLGQGARFITRGAVQLPDGFGAYRVDQYGGVWRITPSGTVTTAATQPDASAYIGVDVDNDGALRATAGSLNLYGGGPGSSGSYTAASGQVLELAAPNETPLYLSAGSSLNRVHVTGYVRASGAVSLTDSSVNGGEISGSGTVTAAGTLTLASGRITGGLQLQAPSATVEVTGYFEVSQGAIASINGSLLLQPNASFYLDSSGQVLTAGSVTMANDSSLSLGPDATFAVSGAMAMADGSYVYDWSNGGTGLFSVASGGSVRSQSSATTQVTFDAPVRNSGTITAQSGTLRIQPSSPSPLQAGTFAADSGATLQLAPYSPLTLGAGAALNRVTIAGQVQLAGRVTASDLVIDGSGTLGGTGTGVLSGSTNIAGTLGGSATTLVPTGSTVLFDNARVADGHDLVIRGTGTVQNGGSLDSGTTIDVVGRLNMTGGSSLSGLGLVYVEGVLGKTGAGDAYVSTGVDNEGTIKVDAGLLSLSNLLNVSQTRGTLVGGHYEAVGTLEVPAIRRNAADVKLIGATASLGQSGSPGLPSLAVNTRRGSITLLNGADLAIEQDVINRGVLSMSQASVVNVTGQFRQGLYGTLVSNLAVGTNGHVVATGDVSLAGTIRLIPAAGYDPMVGRTSDLVSGSSVSGTFANVTQAPPLPRNKVYTVLYSPTKAYAKVTQG